MPIGNEIRTNFTKTKETFSKIQLTDETQEAYQYKLDQLAGIAMQGLIAHYGDVLHIVDGDSRISLHSAAYDHAELMMQVRSARLKT